MWAVFCSIVLQAAQSASGSGLCGRWAIAQTLNSFDLIELRGASFVIDKTFALESFCWVYSVPLKHHPSTIKQRLFATLLFGVHVVLGPVQRGGRSDVMCPVGQHPTNASNNVFGLRHISCRRVVQVVPYIIGKIGVRCVQWDIKHRSDGSTSSLSVDVRACALHSLQLSASFGTTRAPRASRAPNRRSP